MRRRACAGARGQQLGSARCTGLCRTPRAAAQLAAHHGARAAKAECRRKWLSALSSWHRGLLLPRITQRSSGRRSSREAGARPRALSFAGTALPAAHASRAQEHGPTPRSRAENGACFTAFRGAIGPCPTHRGQAAHRNRARGSALKRCDRRVGAGAAGGAGVVREPGHHGGGVQRGRGPRAGGLPALRRRRPPLRPAGANTPTAAAAGRRRHDTVRSSIPLWAGLRAKFHSGPDRRRPCRDVRACCFFLRRARFHPPFCQG